MQFKHVVAIASRVMKLSPQHCSLPAVRVTLIHIEKDHKLKLMFATEGDMLTNKKK